MVLQKYTQQGIEKDGVNDVSMYISMFAFSLIGLFLIFFFS